MSSLDNGAWIFSTLAVTKFAITIYAGVNFDSSFDAEKLTGLFSSMGEFLSGVELAGISKSPSS